MTVVLGHHVDRIRTGRDRQGRRRALATAAVVLLVLTGCGDDDADIAREGGETATTSAPTTSGAAPSTTLVGEDCGTLDNLFGWPTTMLWDSRPGQCLVDAFDAGTPKHLTLFEQTDGEGGHPRITTFEVIGRGSVRLTVDSTRAADGDAGVDITTCTELTTTPHGPPAAAGCS